MSEVIDLDALLPKPVKVKISGKVVDLYPGKLKILVRIQDMANGMSDGEQSLEKVKEMLDLLSEIIPAIKTDKDLDISPLQVNKIIEVGNEIYNKAYIDKLINNLYYQAGLLIEIYLIGYYRFIHIDFVVSRMIMS